jgi:predicted O-methyltransferase YrrM
MFGHAPVDAQRIEVEQPVVDLLVSLVRSIQPRYVIETGTYHGTTAKAIGEALEVGHLVTVEIDAVGVELSREATIGLPVTVIHGSSLDFIPDRPVDFAFLDSGVDVRLLELEHLRPHLAPDAVMAMHDSRDLWPQLDGWRWVNLPTPRGLLLFQADQ